MVRMASADPRNELNEQVDYFDTDERGDQASDTVDV
jgi:hypothetical protein